MTRFAMKPVCAEVRREWQWKTNHGQAIVEWSHDVLVNVPNKLLRTRQYPHKTIAAPSTSHTLPYPSTLSLYSHTTTCPHPPVIIPLHGQVLSDVRSSPS